MLNPYAFPLVIEALTNLRTIIANGCNYTYDHNKKEYSDAHLQIDQNGWDGDG